MKPNDPRVSLAKSAPAVSLCVAIQRAQTSVERGQMAQWIVSAWTTGGTVPDAVVHLVASPAGLPTQFSFGCGTNDGSAACDLGEIAAQSAKRQLQANVTIPATATSLTSVRLSAVGSAAHLPTDPRASATVSVTAVPAPPGAGGGGAGGGAPFPATTTSPLPIGVLPSLDGGTGPNGTLSPGGNAAGLFPTLNPSPDTSPGSPGAGQQKANARTVANTSALPLGAPLVGAQLAGLGVLALAFVLAVTRLSIRRRPAPAKPAGSRPGAAPSSGKDAKPED